MKQLAIGSALGLAVLGGAPGLAPADPYDGLTAYSGVDHEHRLLVRGMIEGAPSAHEWSEPAAFYADARANGCDFANISHHPNRVSCPTHDDMQWYLSNVDPLGFALPGGGHTLNEIEYLAALADDAEDPGSFTASFGMELTSALAPGPSLVGGGHKVALFLDHPTEAPREQSGTGCGPANVSSVSDWHDWVDGHDGVSTFAHPCASHGKACYTGALAPADFELQPEGSVAYSFGVEAGEDISDSDPGEHAGCECTYGYALSLGLRLGATSGSDWHYRPDDLPPGGIQEACTGPRTLVWATANTRAALKAGYLARRTYYSVEGAPEVRFSIADSAGEEVGMGADLLAGPTVRVRVVATEEPDVVQFLWNLHLYHDGDRVLSRTCGRGPGCSFDGVLPSATGPWFAVIERSDGVVGVVTSPIWVSAAVPLLPQAAWLALGLLLGALPLAWTGRARRILGAWPSSRSSRT